MAAFICFSLSHISQNFSPPVWELPCYIFWSQIFLPGKAVLYSVLEFFPQPFKYISQLFFISLTLFLLKESFRDWLLRVKKRIRNNFIFFPAYVIKQVGYFFQDICLNGPCAISTFSYIKRLGNVLSWILLTTSSSRLMQSQYEFYELDYSIA